MVKYYSNITQTESLNNFFDKLIEQKEENKEE
jgi:hypothetical protein